MESAFSALPKNNFKKHLRNLFNKDAMEELTWHSSAGYLAGNTVNKIMKRMNSNRAKKAVTLMHYNMRNKILENKILLTASHIFKDRINNSVE